MCLLSIGYLYNWLQLTSFWGRWLWWDQSHANHQVSCSTWGLAQLLCPVFWVGRLGAQEHVLLLLCIDGRLSWRWMCAFRTGLKQQPATYLSPKANAVKEGRCFSSSSPSFWMFLVWLVFGWLLVGWFIGCVTIPPVERFEIRKRRTSTTYAWSEVSTCCHPIAFVDQHVARQVVSAQERFVALAAHKYSPRAAPLQMLLQRLRLPEALAAAAAAEVLRHPASRGAVQVAVSHQSGCGGER